MWLIKSIRLFIQVVLACANLANRVLDKLDYRQTHYTFCEHATRIPQIVRISYTETFCLE